MKDAVMSRRMVQYGVVDAADAEVASGAPGFWAIWQSKADLKETLMWEEEDELPGPEPDPLCIKVVRPQHAGLSDLQVKVDYMHDAMRRREAQDHTVKLAISSATDKKRQMVEDVCGVETVPSMAIVYEQSKRQRIQQQLSPLASSTDLCGLGMRTLLRKWSA
ncbi:TPA: hypothetical protein ACH3X3_010519 [Trebouxia sp. C0006]